VDDFKVREVGEDDAQRAKVDFVNLMAEDASAKGLPE
jgi:hypothetical protein